MERSALFTDISVNPQLRLGVGACLILPLQFLDTPPNDMDRDDLSGEVLFQRFIDTSSTTLELQAVLWGLDLYRARTPGQVRGSLRLYTDSQSVTGLPGRRKRLEGSSYFSGTGCRLANADLYARFYTAMDELGFEIVKVKGHAPSGSHDSVQRIFSVVDRGARKELKLLLAGTAAGPARTLA